MAFEYKPINNNDVFPIAKDRINQIGEALAKTTDLEFVGTIEGIDFNTIHTQIKDSGVYYLTGAKNYPQDANWNGFCKLYKRDSKYAKVEYTPSNTSKMYIRTLSNNVWSDWDSQILDSEKNKLQTYKLTDSKGQLEHNKVINTTNTGGSKSFYGRLQDPPKGEQDEGWIDYRQSKDNNSSIVEFTPIDSTKTYKKMRKLPEQKQNPNLLEDTLFSEYAYPNYGNNKGTYNYAWEINYENKTNILINYDVRYNNLPTLRIDDSFGTYPMFRHKPLEIGKDVQPGDKLTFSAYMMTYDKSLLKENNMYLDVAKYDDYPDSSNPNIGQTKVYKEDLVDGQWKLVTNTVTVPSDSKYIAPMLRLDTNTSGNSNGFVGYYALPKLEVGEERTPFITNEKDRNQYDEIWSQWIEYLDVNELNNRVPDSAKDGYLDYVWILQGSASKTFDELLQNVPRGTHSFYCHNNIPGSPSNKPVRGTIIVNYESNDPTNTHKATVTCVDTNGRVFTKHKEGDAFSSTKQALTTTTLWEGTIDFGENKTIDLTEPFTDFDYLAITYWTSSAGHDTVKWQGVPKGSTSINTYIRDINVTNNSTSYSISFFEGYLTSEGTKKLKTAMAKQVSHTGTGNASVEYYGTEGIMKVSKIVGVQSN